MLCPLQCSVADNTDALTGNDKIRCARSVAMFFRLLPRTKQLNSTAERSKCVSASHRINIFQRHTIVRTPGLISERAQLRLDVLPGVAQRHVFVLGSLPDRPNRAGTQLKIVAGLVPNSLNFVSGIRLIKGLI